VHRAPCTVHRDRAPCPCPVQAVKARKAMRAGMLRQASVSPKKKYPQRYKFQRMLEMHRQRDIEDRLSHSVCPADKQALVSGMSHA
jgi:hypothetical protein